MHSYDIYFDLFEKQFSPGNLKLQGVNYSRLKSDSKKQSVYILLEKFFFYSTISLLNQTLPSLKSVTLMTVQLKNILEHFH